jgi:L,D-peptidoglycan transpeptidase YkuD (ErfK/YbiS/YcfS/YnhG family)
MNLRVLSDTELECDGKTYRCAIGKNGFTPNKIEGDHCTPTGSFALRECWWRSDRLPHAPQTVLPLREIAQHDGWCDEPTDAHYNTHITLPFASSHETLWRDDHVYDVIVPLGYNDNPVEPGKGSAIFMHVAKPDYAGTEGCVALALPDLLEILSKIRGDSRIEITP